MLTAAFAMLFSVVHYAQPAEIGTRFYLIMAIGGVCAAMVAVAALWACLCDRPATLRLVAYVLAAPAGGFVYLLLKRIEPLLFSAPWYAGVTALQVASLSLPLLLVRYSGYRFRRARTLRAADVGKQTGI
jgi:hypothetical protein